MKRKFYENTNYPKLDIAKLSERIYGYDDNVEPATKEDLGGDISYHKMCKDINDVEKFNFHSDYWGDADDYQEKAISVMQRIKPYIGKKVIIPFDEDKYVSTILGMLIDRQYNSHIKILVDDFVELNENVKMQNRTIKTRITESDENNVTKNNLIALCKKYGYSCNPEIIAYKNANGDISWARISLTLRPINRNDYHPDIYINDLDGDTEIMNTQIGNITVDKIYLKIQTTSYGSIPIDEYVSEFLPAVNDAATLASELENFDYSDLPVIIRD